MIWLSLLAFLATLVAALGAIRWAASHRTEYALNKPQRFHSGNVSRLGGVAVFIGLTTSWGAGRLTTWLGDPSSLHLDVWLFWWWVALLPAFVGGLIEDVTQRLAPRHRLLLSACTALLAVGLLGLRLPRLDLPWLDATWISMPWLGVLVALLAVAGLPHAFNIIDGYNGLSSMVAVIVCLALAHVALQVGDRGLAAALVSLAAATGGFLVWNYPRGLLFAGDGGAYIWGVVIAFASLSLVQRNPDVSPWFPMLLLMYPVWETVFSIYRRVVRGVSPGVADALHFHQLIYRRIVRRVLDDDAARRMLRRNSRTSPYLWAFTLVTVVPALLFWRHTWILMAFCVVFVISYIFAYMAIVRFKVPNWFQP